MQWFFALNEDCPAFGQYAEMAMVAVHTAQLRTSVDPHCIYDGGDNHFTRWLAQRNVPVICRQSFLVPELAALGERRRNPDLLRATRGVFLRVELPELQEQLALDDRVLYTDCDVIFQSDVVDTLTPLQPRYFAVAVESDPAQPDDVNTGAMWMNLPQLRAEDERFRIYITEHINELPELSWDQGAYRAFFRDADGKPIWDTLPPELNWKPYWDDYSHAKIIHFHGPKPFQRNYIDSHWPELKHLTGGHYEELCDVWETLLKEAQ
ncbi:MAG: glycosyltransferase [Chthoniobacterales bacterium]